jgi:hypothetical protein
MGCHRVQTHCDSSRHNPGRAILSPSYRRSRPVALASGVELKLKSNRTSVGVGGVCVALVRLLLAVLRNPPPSCISRHGERRPLTNTRPRIPQAPLLIHLFMPPATSVQRITHPHHTRARVLQCPARPRHSPNNIKTVRLGRSEDPSAPHHSPRCVSRSR